MHWPVMEINNGPSAWQIKCIPPFLLSFSFSTYGSGVYIGLEECLMYCVEWKTRKARPARKSRDDNSPATGRRVKPVQSESNHAWILWNMLLFEGNSLMQLLLWNGDCLCIGRSDCAISKSESFLSFISEAS